jgi:hypothetical protein
MSRTYAAFFSEAQCAMIDLACQSSSDQAVSEMLIAMSQEQQIQFVKIFAAFGDHSRRELEATVATMTEAGRRLEESLQQSNAALQREQQSAAAIAAAMANPQNQRQQQPIHVVSPRQRAVKLDVTKFGGAAGEKLLHWIFQIRAAADAQFIVEDTLRINFAVSNLKDRAQHWAYSLLLPDPHHFGTFDNFIDQLKAAFLPPNSDTGVRARIAVFSCLSLRRVLPS